MGFSRQEYWSGLPFPSPVSTFCQTSPPWPAHLGWPHMVWLSFIELDMPVFLVWLDWLVFCEYGFSVSALLQHLPSYLGSLTLGMKYLFMAAPAKCSRCSLPWVNALPDLQREVAPLGPPAPEQPPLLGRGVASPCHRPWPGTPDGCSRPLPLASDVGWLLH